MSEIKIYPATEGNVQRPVNESIPVIEEQINIGKQTIETGKVHIAKKVLTEDFNARIPVLKEDVVVEKVTINQYVDGPAPGIRIEGDTTVIPVIKEVIVKRVLLVEEIYITKRSVETIAEVNEVLRKEQVTVTRTGANAGNE